MRLRSVQSLVAPRRDRVLAVAVWLVAVVGVLVALQVVSDVRLGTALGTPTYCLFADASCFALRVGVYRLVALIWLLLVAGVVRLKERVLALLHQPDSRQHLRRGENVPCWAGLGGGRWRPLGHLPQVPD